MFLYLSDLSLSLFWVSSGGEAMERLTTLGIAVNLVTYLTGTMHLGNATSANTVTNFLGTSFMLCLLGGFIADTFLGRFNQFFALSVFYLVLYLFLNSGLVSAFCFLNPFLCFMTGISPSPSSPPCKQR